MEIKLDKTQNELWWTTFGRWLEEEIEEVKNDPRLLEKEKEKKLEKLWLEYLVSSRLDFQT